MTCSDPLYRLAASPDSLRSLGFINDNRSLFLGKRPHRGAYFFKKKDLPLIPEDFRSNLQPIGCGRCLACRLSYANEWSTRLKLESSLYNYNLFLTLTYDDDHLPESAYVDYVTGEFHLSEVSKLDISRFLKALRQKLQKDFNWHGVRFFGSLEYGDKTDRPHAHLILMNLPEQLQRYLIFLSRNSRGDTLYKCPYLDQIWKRGFVTVGQVTSESIGYTARYCLKKVSAFEQTCDRPQPCAVMSRRPGIGEPYFDKHKDSIELTGKVVVTENGRSRIISAPSYFLYLSKNLPIRAHRVPDLPGHYFRSVLQSERCADSKVKAFKEARSPALEHRADAYAADLLGLPRAARETSLGQLEAASIKNEILKSSQKKYEKCYKQL